MIKTNNHYIQVLLFFELLFIPLIMKLYFIFTAFKENVFFIAFEVICHDAIILFFILLLSYFSYMIKNKITAVLLRAGAIAVFFVYFADVIILNLFATHLTLNDFIKFIDYVPTYISQEFSFDIFKIVVISTALIILGLFLKKEFTINRKRDHLGINILLVSFLVLNLNASEASYIHSWIYKNFFEYNLEIESQSKEYTKEFIENFNYKENMITKESIEKTDKNIIILMVESLSSYQSKLFSGLNDWTPNIDKIAEENIYFTNFHANGFVTEDAEISILTGRLPIFAPKVFSNGGGVSFKGFFNEKNSLPNILNKEGYETEFLTSSDLNFSNTGKWAESIGFKYIEGAEHPDYKGLPRFHFKAAEDRYLYGRVLKRVKKNKGNKYFLFIKTVSSHVPFVNPENKRSSEVETINYIDREIGRFYKKLQKENFFENGILLIVGDHHPTMRVREDFIKKYGIYKAPAMVPMIIVNGKAF